MAKLLNFYLNLALLLVACKQTAGQIRPAIVGGQKFDIERVPWLVKIHGTTCGGAIYAQDIIITAAHCLRRAPPLETLKVRAGSTYRDTGGQLVQVAAYLMHENFKLLPLNLTNDVAVMRLKGALRFNNAVQPIELATQSPEGGSLAFVAGWGRLSFSDRVGSTVLRGIWLRIISHSECSSSLYRYGPLQADTICAAAPDKGPCQGDSGSPLVSYQKLVGLVSFGAVCAQKGYPGVYTDVAKHRQWLLNAIKKIRSARQ